MELVKCTLVEASIRFGEYSRNLGPGAILDLDEVVGEMPDVTVGDAVVTPARPVRVRDLLEGRLDAFVPIEGEAKDRVAADVKGSRSPNRRAPREKE